jgi:hypothetical protein
MSAAEAAVNVADEFRRRRELWGDIDGGER